jgi:hypothetical protein
MARDGRARFVGLAGVAGLALTAVLVMTAVPAQAVTAKRTARSTVAGNDISYPQCGTRYPAGQAFGIVGVNDGLANNDSPCFASEFAWAQGSPGLPTQPPASVYVNTGNPSGAGPVWWPTSNTFYDASDGTDSNTAFAGSTQVGVPVPAAYGACAADNDAGCSYVYGWAKAYEDFNHRGVPSPSSQHWWFDVETTNSWETPGSAYPTAYTSNIADLKGMADYFTSRGAAVGIYSTGYQWGQITGGTIALGSGDPFAGIPNWVAGATSSTAAAYCGSSYAFTYSSKVTLTQYVSRRLDYDHSCA